VIKNFRFEEGAVALSGIPETSEAVDWLHEQGIRAVVSLHPVSEDARRRMDELGIEWYRSSSRTSLAVSRPASQTPWNSSAGEPGKAVRR